MKSVKPAARPFVAFPALIVMMAALLLLSSCGAKNTLVSSGTGFKNQKTGNEYICAPSCYQPVSYGSEYAVYKSKKMPLSFCEITGLDPEKWLYSDSADLLLCSPGETLPTLAEFEPNAVYLCVSEVATLSLATIEDADTIKALVDAFTSGAAINYPATAADLTYSLKFASEKYPSLYYSITYIDYGTSRCLYDRSSGRCVDAGNILDAYTVDSVTTADTSAETAAVTEA